MDQIEALAYLTGRGLDNELASKLYSLVGGRVVHLEQVANDIKKQGMTYEYMDRARHGFVDKIRIRNPIRNPQVNSSCGLRMRIWKKAADAIRAELIGLSTDLRMKSLSASNSGCGLRMRI